MPAPRVPKVTIGPAKVLNAPTQTLGEATGTGQRIPKVTIGRAYAGDGPQIGTLIIEEISGPDRRKIVLRERALPYSGAAFGVTHRIDETDYTGFPQTSQQALGAKWDDTELKGAWKTRFIGADAARMIEVSTSATEMVDGAEAISIVNNRARTAAQAVGVFEDLAAKGQVLRVSWFHVVRIGRLANFVPTWKSIHDVEWAMKFKWIGRDEDAGYPAVGGHGATTISLPLQVSSAYNNLKNKTDLDDVDLDPSLADRIDSRVGRIKRSVRDLHAAANDRVESVTGAAEAMRRLMTLSTFIRNEAQTFIDEADEVVYSAVVAVENPSNLLEVPAGRAIQAACAIRESVKAARTLKHVAARQRHEAARQLERNVLAIVLLGQDEDVAALSQRYYGTPEEGRRIRLFNNLDSNTAPAGTVVIIPIMDDAE